MERDFRARSQTCIVRWDRTSDSSAGGFLDPVHNHSAFSETFFGFSFRIANHGQKFLLLIQFSGINGVLYYTPQILEQAGVSVLLSNLGLSSTSASLLISALTTLLMLPSIGIAMRLMDVAGRR